MKEEGGDCATCEYEQEKSGEHCNSLSMCWKEAGWIKDKEITRLRAMNAEMVEALKKAQRVLSSTGLGCAKDYVDAAINMAAKEGGAK